jgi:hypothetical protein
LTYVPSSVAPATALFSVLSPDPFGPAKMTNVGAVMQQPWDYLQRYPEDNFDNTRIVIGAACFKLALIFFAVLGGGLARDNGACRGTFVHHLATTPDRQQVSAYHSLLTHSITRHFGEFGQFRCIQSFLGHVHITNVTTKCRPNYDTESAIYTI